MPGQTASSSSSFVCRRADRSVSSPAWKWSKSIDPSSANGVTIAVRTSPSEIEAGERARR